MRIAGRAAVVIAAAACAWLAAPAGVRAEVVDRVMAVVDRQIITLADVRAAVSLGLVDARDEAGALDALVLRTLVLAEVARYAPPPPAADLVESRLDAVLARLGPGNLEAALRRSGLDTDHLRLFLRQDLLIESYLAQRFSVTAVPTDEQVEEYYKERRATFVDASGQAMGTDAALALARRRLTDERRQRLIAEWNADLRRRAQVRVLALRP